MYRASLGARYLPLSGRFGRISRPARVVYQSWRPSATTLDDLNKYMVVAAATIDGMAGQGGFSTPARRSIRTVTYRV